ncbi:hypothetical protein NEOKW01_1907 [Nematocida sp. AWRm80]|nr:hypothetical protein NEOKW01_1907 [Nematocida sp. AWRm80]
MNIQSLFENIKRKDSFNAFWKYPEEKNLSMLEEKLGHIKNALELKQAINQICRLVFDKNEEGSFLYTEAQNLLRYSEALITKAVALANLTGSYLDGSTSKEEPNPNAIVFWETSVIDKLCHHYKKSLLEFTSNIQATEVQQHVQLVLFGIDPTNPQ